MQPSATQRYQVRNLDCAVCAAKLEKALNRMEGIEEAVVDFAGATLQVRGHDLAQVPAMVRRIAPEVELDTESGPPPDRQEASAYRFTRELVLLSGAAILFVVQLLLQERLRASGALALDIALAVGAYLLSGWNVIAKAARTVRRGDFFDENVLMTIATVGAFAVDALSEAVGVMLFYKVGEMLQEMAVSRSRRSIAALLAVRPERAAVQSPFGLRRVPPEQVAVGETIVVKPGEKIPLDGVVVTGQSQVDTSPLTGEPKPSAVAPGAGVLAGTINLSAALNVRVTRPYGESSIARIVDLVQHAAARKANTEKFITTFSRYYTPAMVAAAALIALVPPMTLPSAEFHTWIYRALVLLVISCPCALVISIPLGYFGGIGRASRRGILVKGSNFLDALAHVKTVVFDKTGTLTEGHFEVEDVVSTDGYRAEALLAFAAAAELHSTHPIGASILKAFAATGGKLDAASVVSHEAIGGAGVRAVWSDHDILVGNDALLHREGIDHGACVLDGTVANVAVDGVYAGYIRIGDRLKPQARQAMEALRATGVERLIMLTGDNRCTAEKVASALGLDRFHADLMPEDKLRRLEDILDAPDHSGKVAAVGDGINDAPILARADVGVAMGALGSDAAIETADVVLMTDSPTKVAEAITIARRTRRIVWQNIVLALSVKGVFVALGAVGLAGMWEAVFADVGTAVLAVLNATRALGGDFTTAGRSRRTRQEVSAEPPAGDNAGIRVERASGGP